MLDYMQVYVESVEDEIDDLHDFRTATTARLVEHGLQVPKLRDEVDKLRSVIREQGEQVTRMWTELNHVRSIVKSCCHGNNVLEGRGSSVTTANKIS